MGNRGDASQLGGASSALWVGSSQLCDPDDPLPHHSGQAAASCATLMTPPSRPPRPPSPAHSRTLPPAPQRTSRQQLQSEALLLGSQHRLCLPLWHHAGSRPAGQPGQTGHRAGPGCAGCRSTPVCWDGVGWGWRARQELLADDGVRRVVRQELLAHRSIQATLPQCG